MVLMDLYERVAKKNTTITIARTTLTHNNNSKHKKNHDRNNFGNNNNKAVKTHTHTRKDTSVIQMLYCTYHLHRKVNYRIYECMYAQLQQHPLSHITTTYPLRRRNLPVSKGEKMPVIHTRWEAVRCPTVYHSVAFSFDVPFSLRLCFDSIETVTLSNLSVLCPIYFVVIYEYKVVIVKE